MKTKIRKFEIDIVDNDSVIGSIFTNSAGELGFHPDIDLNMTQLKDVTEQLGKWQKTYDRMNKDAA